MNRKTFLKTMLAVPFLSSCFRSPQANKIDTFVEDVNPIRIIVMSGDHKHSEISIPENDIILGIGGIYKLSVHNNHSHNFTILPNQMRFLRDGITTSLFTSGSGGHEHSFSIQYQPSENK